MRAEATFRTQSGGGKEQDGRAQRGQVQTVNKGSELCEQQQDVCEQLATRCLKKYFLRRLFSTQQSRAGSDQFQKKVGQTFPNY